MSPDGQDHFLQPHRRLGLLSQNMGIYWIVDELVKVASEDLLVTTLYMATLAGCIVGLFSPWIFTGQYQRQVKTQEDNQCEA